MKANHLSIMDELRRVLLPMELCEQLGWKTGSKVNAQINKSDKSLHIYTSSVNIAGDSKMVIDELGRVTLEEGVLGELGWDIGKLSISIDSTGSLLLLKQTTNM